MIRNTRFLYQFGDPYYDDKLAWLFNQTELSYSLPKSIKVKNQDSPFSDGSSDMYNQNLAFIDGGELTIKLTVLEKNTSGVLNSLDYLKAVFTRKKRKIFFVEKEIDGYKPRFFYNYARYIGGLEDRTSANDTQNFQTGNNTLQFTLKLILDSPFLFECDSNLKVLDNTVITDVSKITWGDSRYTWGDAGLSYGVTAVGYEKVISSLSGTELETFFSSQKLCKPTFYLTHKDLFLLPDDINIDTNNSTSFTLTSNLTKTIQSTSEMDLNTSDNSNILHLKLATTGGFATNQYLSIWNSNNYSGLKFTWLATANSPASILINTAIFGGVYDLTTQNIIDSSFYSLTLPDNQTGRLLTFSKLISNPIAGIDSITTELFVCEKNTTNNLIINIKNLKTYL